MDGTIDEQVQVFLFPFVCVRRFEWPARECEERKEGELTTCFERKTFDVVPGWIVASSPTIFPLPHIKIEGGGGLGREARKRCALGDLRGEERKI